MRDFYHFYTSELSSFTVIAHFAAHFARISSMFLNFNCQMCVFPLIQFRIDVPDERRDVMVLAEGVKISISTHNLCPPPTIDDGSTPLIPDISCGQVSSPQGVTIWKYFPHHRGVVVSLAAATATSLIIECKLM